ncbi:SCO family protein [Litchfieldia salsa]|uniref:Protein SCO1/2 n=1 Tax=Litchfieldia salsa TaxID=930152 RepID=A0A1H0S1T1_9BACI|nr:SCO family protein [Litchfieldia salsa]SDP35680.1 protein SCO1/2 [Litchfieldia salsa]
MHDVKKIMSMVFLVLILIACSKEPTIEEIEQTFPMNINVGKLEAVNQNKEPFNTDQLEDKVWLASFIFTNCDTVCSPMTATMARLQTKLQSEGLEDVQIVSFSIDPEHDTPEVLLDFANSMDADFTNWQFITGYNQEEIESFANTSFLSPAAQLEGSNQFVHSTSIYLVNQRGTVLNQYDAVADTPFEEIISDIRKLK